MAIAEWWLEPADQKIRFPTCGHIILAEDLCDAFFEQRRDAVVCPVCAAEDHGTPAGSEARPEPLCVRDGLPHASSTWGAGRCRLRMKLVDRSGVEVGVFGTYMPVRESHGRMLALGSPPTHAACTN